MVDKARKEEIVTEVKDALDGANTVVVANYESLSISQSDELRQNAKKTGAGVRVAKNTLAKIASKDSKHSNIVDLFSGQVIFAYSEDPVAAAKIFVDFAKDNETFSIAGGSYDGEAIDSDKIKALASTPSLDESRAKIVGLLVAPTGKIASVTAAPAGQLARVFSAYGASEG